LTSSKSSDYSRILTYEFIKLQWTAPAWCVLHYIAQWTYMARKYEHLF